MEEGTNPLIAFIFRLYYAGISVESGERKLAMPPVDATYKQTPYYR
jgi:hypothetical protein